MRVRVIAGLGLLVLGVGGTGCGNGTPSQSTEQLAKMQEKEQREVDDAERAMQKEMQPKTGKKK